MLGTVVRVVLAAALAVAALALVAYGAILISAAITGSSDTAPEVLVGFGVAFVAGAIVAGCIAWMLSRGVRGLYRDRRV
jgi:hypothetical protein